LLGRAERSIPLRARGARNAPVRRGRSLLACLFVTSLVFESKAEPKRHATLAASPYIRSESSPYQGPSCIVARGGLQGGWDPSTVRRLSARPATTVTHPTLDSDSPVVRLQTEAAPQEAPVQCGDRKSLIKEGNVVDGSAVDLARVGLGFAVKQGASPKSASLSLRYQRYHQ
jgi:hypothetical protein